MKKTIDTITSEEESAFIALKKRCDGSVLFSKNLSEITEAELAYIHAISGWNYEEADFISSKIIEPNPIRTLRPTLEWGLYIYEDGSLFDSNNDQSEVFCDYSDYVERVGLEEFTLCEREFFKVNSPDDDEAFDFVVNIRKYFKYKVMHDELAKDYYKDKILTFASRNKARNWIRENEPKKDHLYRCSYNEYLRPSYTIIAR